jgi:hypothetical protein
LCKYKYLIHRRVVELRIEENGELKVESGKLGAAFNFPLLFSRRGQGKVYLLQHKER